MIVRKALIVGISMMLLLGVVLAPTALAQTSIRPQDLPARLQQARLETPITTDGSALRAKLDAGLRAAQGRQQVVVTLSETPAVRAAEGAAQQAQSATVAAQQDALIAQARAIDPNLKVLGQVKLVLNAIVFDIDAAALPVLAANGNVASILPSVSYQRTLNETVPYIGATPPVQARAADGRGVRVAVLDSGIDYTHAKLGGPGTLEAYALAYCGNPTATPDPEDTTACPPAYNTLPPTSLFPNSKVIGGYDFVGERYVRLSAGTIPEPDPNPIDFETHGTHVADIIAGLPIAGAGGGVAPAAQVYALKVCGPFGDSDCPDVALLQAMDFAVDPNGDNSTADHVDIINMSLGSDYSIAYEDPLSTAVDNATALGVLTVASAGNGGNRPFIAGTPANARTSLSVAQTQVPSAKQFVLRITAPASIARIETNTATVDWAPLTNGFSGDVVFVGRGCPAADGVAEDPYLASPAGKVALIDRGACNVSTKVDRAAKAGATAVLIGLVAPGDASAFGFGGGDTFVQTIVITQRASTDIKRALTAGQTVSVAVSANDAIPTVGTMVGSSARGPSGGKMYYGDRRQYGQLIKPEIGAPGASVSAVAGSGTGTQAFGGTSGAGPMVAGAAALLVNATNRTLTPLELKARLINTGETNIRTSPEVLGGDLAPITRIGGGEVRIDRAIAAQAIAYEFTSSNGVLSFGRLDVTQPRLTTQRTVTVRNFGATPLTYRISSNLRFANDIANGAVTLTPSLNSITVPARSRASFRVVLNIDGTKLREWGLNSGALGASGPTLDIFEYDGYLSLDAPGSANDLHMPWHVLPRLSGELYAPPSARLTTTFEGLPAARVNTVNSGVGPAYVDSYSLLATSPQQQRKPPGSNEAYVDLRAVGVNTFPVPADFCLSDPSFLMVFVLNTWDRQSLALGPAVFEVQLDTNGDGQEDYVVFNADVSELSGAAVDGRNVAAVLDLKTNLVDAFFFTEHTMNSTNTALTVCAEQIGLTVADVGKPIRANVIAFDSFFSGKVTDVVEGLTIVPGGERYVGLAPDLAPGASGPLTIVDFGPTGTNPSERGLLLVSTGVRTNAAGDSVSSGAREDNEARIITIEP